MKTNYIVRTEDREIRLLQKPYKMTLDNQPTKYYAAGKDYLDNEFMLEWNIIDPYSMFFEDICNWEKPDNVYEIYMNI